MTFHLRADASAQGGLGHLMRQIAVAEAAGAHGYAVRLVGDAPSRVVRFVRHLGFDLSAPNEDAWLSDVRRDDVVVFDGYRFGSDDFEAAGRTGATVGVVEDSGRGRYLVDVVLNQNLVDEIHLETDARTRVLSGPRYALVRQAFREHRRHRGDEFGRVAVVLGGSDPSGLTHVVARAVASSLSHVEVTCVVGPAARRADLDAERPRIHLVREPDEVAAVLDRVDAVVSAAGSTTWELLCMGLPTVLIQVADNQRHVGRPAAERGAALFAGGLPLDLERLAGCLEELADPHVRERLSVEGRTLVDGSGPRRFVWALVED